MPIPKGTTKQSRGREGSMPMKEKKQVMASMHKGMKDMTPTGPGKMPGKKAKS